MTTTVTPTRFQVKKRTNLTKVLGRAAFITVDSDNAGPEHLKGGNVGREDAESAGECGDVHLFHTGLFEKHLQRERNTFVRTFMESSAGVCTQKDRMSLHFLRYKICMQIEL